jgi:hypothetical protein
MIPASQSQTTAANSAVSNHRDRLQVWCIVRLLPNVQRVVVGRFRKRNDAEDHLKILRRLEPDAVFIIFFDLPV